MKLPGINVPVGDLPEELIGPLFISPIATICGLVGPYVGEETKGSVLVELMLTIT